MAINTYTTLDAAIDNWMKRTDLTDRIPEFIAIAEARIWYGDEDPQFGNEPLRVRDMEATTDLTIGSDGNASLPSDFLAAKRLYIRASGTNTELQYFPPTDFHAREFSQDAGVPIGYTIEGGNVVFGSAKTGTPKLLYYKKLDALDSSDGSSTNAILTTNPIIYLSGALLEANLYIKEWDEALVWVRRFRSTIGGWNGSDRRDRNIGPLVSKPVAIA